MGETEVKRVICHAGVGGCWQLCGLLAHVDKETGKLVKLTGNPDYPTNRGAVPCPERVANMPRLLHHPQALLYSVKRKGERGENKWEKTSYDAALDEIGGKLKDLVSKYGPETLAVAEGTYRSDLYWARARFLNLLGNPHNEVGVGIMCYCNDIALHHAMMGANISGADIVNSRCIVTQGNSMLESFPFNWSYIERRRREKEKPHLIVIDPRLTESARQADLWLQIRPGSDGALFMGWLNVIMNESLYKRDFVEKWTNAPFLVRTDKNKMLREEDLRSGGSKGKFVIWDAAKNDVAVWNPDSLEYEPADAKPTLEGAFTVTLADGGKAECKTVWQIILERVREYTPERVEQITWISAWKVVESARMFAKNTPACLHWSVATDQLGRNSTRIEQTRMIIRALCECIDVEGGEIVPGPGKIPFLRGAHLQMEDKCPPEQRRKQLGSDTVRLTTWPGYEATYPYHMKRYGIPRPLVGHSFQTSWPLLTRAILSGKPYPIKALIIWSANPLVTAPNTKLVHKALKSPNLELLVVLEHFMTPTAQLADYVLATATKLERPWVDCFEDFNAEVWASEAAIKPQGERRPDYDFFRGVAVRLGYGEHFPWATIEEALEARLKPLGITIAEAAKRGVTLNPEGFRRFEEVNPATGKPKGFGTASGRIELWSTVLEALGYDPLPRYEEPPESPYSTPMLAREFPFILITGGRFRPQFHSEGRHYGAGYRELYPDPLMDIHPTTARDLGIANGDWVWIETRRGRIRQRARLNFGIHPRVINAQHGWWYPEMPGEEPWLHGAFISNSNVLVLDEPETLDELAGGWANRALLCKVYKVERA